ncbi:transmembrane protein 25 isoform X1 [Gadus morhua]|uniref:transmembrane protein 25 isoform X1 n=1 Tax=Gadus morhua TaxID=8049 RepID=UPI0011B5BD66|nr:transmembrane protein 25 isoform X1 [Gadus morhua]XP_030236459.1 transmembrane protein 25 isoform X1 [Gadus morhua]
MECVSPHWWGPVTAVLLFHTLSWSRTGAIEPAPKIDGRHRSTITLQENITHRFKCHSDGWDPHAPPLLTWYLNGRQQNDPGQEHGHGRPALAPPLQEGSRVVLRPVSRSHHNSTFVLRARKWDRELVCTAANPHTGESYNATVTLNVQFQPEILRVKAHYSETSDPSDLSLVLFALVRSNPPATLTFVDQSGQMVANTSDLLVLDARSYPWLANHTLKVTLSSLSGNVSMNASNSVGTAQSNLTLAEFLQSRVEVPMLGIVTGGAMAFMALLILSLIVLCLMQKNSKAIDEPVEILMTKKSPALFTRSTSAILKTEKVDKAHLPRENMSLPSNMQLNDLCTLRRAREAAREAAKRRSLGEERRWPVGGEDDDLTAAYAARGFSRYPMVGYIYKVNSTSSEEIWL